MRIRPSIRLNPGPVEYKPLIPSGLVLVIDTREQAPYVPGGVPSVRRKLDYGDYSIKGFERQASVERKSLDDFYLSIGNNRNRFKRMLERMQEAEFRGLVIEGYEDEVLSPERSYSSIHRDSVYATIVALEIKYGLHIYMGSRKSCESKMLNWLIYFYRMKRRVLDGGDKT
jgi:ERCC4-type nuclease